MCCHLPLCNVTAVPFPAKIKLLARKIQPQSGCCGFEFTNSGHLILVRQEDLLAIAQSLAETRHPVTPRFFTVRSNDQPSRDSGDLSPFFGVCPEPRVETHKRWLMRGASMGALRFVPERQHDSSLATTQVEEQAKGQVKYHMKKKCFVIHFLKMLCRLASGYAISACQS
jgi:hypothetical protein